MLPDLGQFLYINLDDLECWWEVMLVGFDPKLFSPPSVSQVLFRWHSGPAVRCHEYQVSA